MCQITQNHFEQSAQHFFGKRINLKETQLI